MSLYETIETRRAVRQFNSERLPVATLAEIKAFLEKVTPLTGETADFKFELGENVGGVSAPHCILAYCQSTDVALVNVGYVLQKVDLYLQSQGLGSIWIGQGKPKETENYCILLAFGKTDVPARKSEAEFDRLPIEKISQVDNRIARSVRLAPSAMNSQPWEIAFSDKKVILTLHPRGAMQLLLKKEKNKIDLGIATRHAVEALRHEGHDVTGILVQTTDKQLCVEVTY